MGSDFGSAATFAENFPVRVISMAPAAASQLGNPKRSVSTIATPAAAAHPTRSHQPTGLLFSR
jgi:hypothetical protein